MHFCYYRPICSVFPSVPASDSLSSMLMRGHVNISLPSRLQIFIDIKNVMLTMGFVLKTLAVSEHSTVELSCRYFNLIDIFLVVI